MDVLGPALVIAVIVAVVLVVVRRAQGKPMLYEQSNAARAGYVVAGVVVLAAGVFFLTRS